MTKQIKVNTLKLHEDAMIPEYKTPGASGVDLRTVKTIVIEPKDTVIVGTGLAFEIPEGYEMQIRPRSGLSAKTKLRVANSPGTIDSDYRGEVGIILDNTSNVLPITIEAGERIAQAVIQKVEQVIFEEVDQLSDTKRGKGGFGSTGTK